MSAVSAHVDRLRTLRGPDVRVPTISQLATLADDVFNAVALDDTLAKDEFDGFTATEVATIAGELGQFLSRTHRGNEKATAQLESDWEMFKLQFPDLSRAAILERNDSARRYLDAKAAGAVWRRKAGDPSVAEIRNWLAYAPDEFLKPVPDAIVAQGYEPAALGRNIVTSLAALANINPTMAELERFWARRYNVAVPELTGEHLHLVWWLAANDLGSKLDELEATHEHLASLLVRAHDLLETHLADARAALAAVTSAGAAEGALDALGDAVTTCSWLDQGLFSRVTLVLDQARAAVSAGTGDPTRLRQVLNTRLGGVRAWMTSGARAASDIRYLNAGHLIALCARSGLDTDTGEERTVRDALRTRLIEIGLGADLDQEIPNAMSAWRAGRIEEFFESRLARVQGVANWAEMFQAAEA